jgi:hypothetical protein
MTNKGKKRTEKKAVEEPVIEKSEVVENEPMVIDPEILKVDAPEAEKEITPEELVVQEEFIEEVPVVEGLKYDEDFKPEDQPDALTLESHTEPCACTEPCTEPCTCQEETPVVAELLAPQIISVVPVETPKPQRTLESLNRAELRGFMRTGRMPK